MNKHIRAHTHPNTECTPELKRVDGKATTLGRDGQSQTVAFQPREACRSQESDCPATVCPTVSEKNAVGLVFLLQVRRGFPPRTASSLLPPLQLNLPSRDKVPTIGKASSLPGKVPESGLIHPTSVGEGVLLPGRKSN